MRKSKYIMQLMMLLELKMVTKIFKSINLIY